GVADGELEVDAVAQRGEARGAEDGGPALAVGVAGEQAGGGEQLLEPVGAEVLGEGVALFVEQEVLEVLAHERLVVEDGLEAGGARCVDAGDDLLIGGGAAQALGVGVVDAAREGEVPQEALAVEDAAAAVEVELVVEDLGLEAVEGGG